MKSKMVLARYVQLGDVMWTDDGEFLVTRAYTDNAGTTWISSTHAGGAFAHTYLAEDQIEILKPEVPRSKATDGMASAIRACNDAIGGLHGVAPPSGRKDDQGKPQYRLLPTRGLAAIVDVLTFGAVKYAPDNWQRVDNASARYEDAMLRHLFAWKAGETNDPESGLPHLAHAGCCLLFLMHFELAPE
jgi:hypothetical protein